ncbi:hypothetical protein ElyMa_004033700 [Elysia marginata]|uniref:Uncharacterized protein n=1 Tax=Elysia marginata TaxID=1093978 RepID=A0AAV4G3T4_9GAST|nr:hypothetical protein ElyMa_004033700 [Elysia marginata]
MLETCPARQATISDTRPARQGCSTVTRLSTGMSGHLRGYCCRNCVISNALYGIVYDVFGCIDGRVHVAGNVACEGHTLTPTELRHSGCEVQKVLVAILQPMILGLSRNWQLMRSAENSTRCSLRLTGDGQGPSNKFIGDLEQDGQYNDDR